MVGAAALCSLAVWVYLAVAHGRFWKSNQLLAAAPTLPSEAAEIRVVVIVPARDEAATIESCVQSLVAQDWPGRLAVIVVDDSSSDDTAILAERAGANRVVHARPLPSGWTGKLWALQTGVETAAFFEPDFLLFTDADIVHHSTNVSELVARALDRRLDLVSLMVRLNCSYPAERLLIPAFVFFFFLLFPPSRIQSRRSSVAGAAGGCILLRPEALERAGGLHGIRDQLIDDCSLARVVKRAGGKLWLGLSEETRSVREYRHIADVRHMIARTAYTQLRYSPALLTGCVAGMMFLFGAPLAAALSGNAAGGAALLTMAAIYLPLVRYFRQPWYTAFLLPVAAGAYVWATVESAWRYHLRSGAEWKGRHQAQPAGDSHGSG